MRSLLPCQTQQLTSRARRTVPGIVTKALADGQTCSDVMVTFVQIRKEEQKVVVEGNNCVRFERTSYLEGK